MSETSLAEAEQQRAIWFAAAMALARGASYRVDGAMLAGADRGRAQRELDRWDREIVRIIRRDRARQRLSSDAAPRPPVLPAGRAMRGFSERIKAWLA